MAKSKSKEDDKQLKIRKRNNAYSELAVNFPNIQTPDLKGDCRGMPTEWWFPEFGNKGNHAFFERAREICMGCHARKECLEFAIQNPGIQGMWGGLSPRQRRNERRKRDHDGVLKLKNKVLNLQKSR